MKTIDNTKQSLICESCEKEPIHTINVQRFIDKLDRYFQTNDLEGARKHLEYWEIDARSKGDNRGLLSILNEEIGFSRRINDKILAEKAVNNAIDLIEEEDLIMSASGAIIYVNIATTLNAFGKPEKALPIYQKAQKALLEYGKEESYEFASLLNNKATTLCNLEDYDEAEECIQKAIAILKKDGTHDGEIAVSLMNLAHLIYNRNEKDVKRVEETIDLAWDYINSPNQPHDANFAFIISKCAPSYRYFNRELEAESLEETAAEIYGRKSK